MKTFKIILAFIALIYVIGFIFNHIGPWFAIGTTIAVIYYTIKQVNKKQNEEN
jgi:4-hydroxybenzoate polyprenyltransferase